MLQASGRSVCWLDHPTLAAETLGDKAKPRIGLKAPDVTPPEDLMREQGVLDRVLPIYEAAMKKASASGDFDPPVVA